MKLRSKQEIIEKRKMKVAIIAGRVGRVQIKDRRAPKNRREMGRGDGKRKTLRGSGCAVLLKSRPEE